MRHVIKLIENYKSEKDLADVEPHKHEEWENIHTYLKALTNLYGLMPIEKFVEIYNDQNETQIELDHLAYIDYDPSSKNIIDFIGLKDGYLFNVDILIGGNLKSLLKAKTGKPYFIPDKADMMKYAQRAYFEENKAYLDLRDFFRGLYWRKKKADKLALELQLLVSRKHDINIFFERNEVRLTEDKMEALQGLIRNLSVNTRLWEHNGYTTNELNGLISIK